MDLRQLNHLIAVAEHQSFSAAARALHTVQSNVSTHVAKLEKELGAALIDRHTMQPTAEGRAVLERARRIRTELQAINDDIVSMRHEVAGEVRIGCIGTTGRWMASPLLGRLAERHPALRPVLVDATTTSLTPRVLDGDLDMAIVNTPVVEAGLESEPLFDEERIIVAPADHPLADRGTIDVADLAEHPVMLTPRGTTFRDAIDQELAAAGVRLTAAAEVDGLRLLASLAYQGYAPALLPASAVSGYPDGNWSLVHVEGLARRSVGLVRNRRTTPSMPIRAAREVVLDVIREIAPRQPGIHVTLDG
jgi:LysR family hydrogen peroxide-inducible transcriptional activator|tara:strand:- start:977 stop:1894 length:918 start_codon:yes stop_codon:yes gene_type:complete